MSVPAVFASVLQKMRLLPCQASAVRRLLEHVDKQNILFTAPCGSGKTRVMIALVVWWYLFAEKIPLDCCVIVVSNPFEVHQFGEKLRALKVLPTKAWTTYTTKQRNVDVDARVIITAATTMTRSGAKHVTCKKKGPSLVHFAVDARGVLVLRVARHSGPVVVDTIEKHVAFVMLDEVHKFCAPLGVEGILRKVARASHVRIVATTATPSRRQEGEWASVTGCLGTGAAAVHVSYADARADGLIKQVDAHVCVVRSNDDAFVELQRLLEYYKADGRVTVLVKVFRRESANRVYAPRKYTMVRVVGGITQQEYRDVTQCVREGTLKEIVTTDKIIHGWDPGPRARVVIEVKTDAEFPSEHTWTTLTRSVQIIGRVMRGSLQVGAPGVATYIAMVDSDNGRRTTENMLRECKRLDIVQSVKTHDSLTETFLPPVPPHVQPYTITPVWRSVPHSLLVAVDARLRFVRGARVAEVINAADDLNTVNIAHIITPGATLMIGTGSDEAQRVVVALNVVRTPFDNIRHYREVLDQCTSLCPATARAWNELFVALRKELDSPNVCAARVGLQLAHFVDTVGAEGVSRRVQLRECAELSSLGVYVALLETALAGVHMSHTTTTCSVTPHKLHLVEPWAHEDCIALDVSMVGAPMEFRNAMWYYWSESTCVPDDPDALARRPAPPRSSDSYFLQRVVDDAPCAAVVITWTDVLHVAAHVLPEKALGVLHAMHARGNARSDHGLLPEERMKLRVLAKWGVVDSARDLWRLRQPSSAAPNSVAFVLRRLVHAVTCYRDTCSGRRALLARKVAEWCRMFEMKLLSR